MQKRRPRTGLYIFVGLVVAAVGALAYLGLGSALTGDAGQVERVQTPAIEDPPAAVSERVADEARAKESSAEEEAARERAAEERAAAEERREAEAVVAPEDPTMYLTVPALGIENVPVINEDSEAALEAGTQHVTSTGFPWQEGANTYIAGHRLGYPGTASDHIFYDLPRLGAGDEITLTDSNGEVYNYAVTNIVEVSPTDTWVMNPPSSGNDMVSLQTCIENFGDYWTEGPNWFARYVVQAERV
ncbi:sortase [Rubrobacter marinus]|uniref:Sortase n=1 Tax=Rubrobacter marinus TaxID=2653852 RepID=A0A6G8PYA7_9ACTN|nr:class E sortase [Rubrobacter marinus]QIN79209.1 sortase [Rubrobacter marinus]